MTNTPPKIDKYDTHKKIVPYKKNTPFKKCQGYLPRAKWFLKGILNFVALFGHMFMGF